MNNPTDEGWLANFLQTAEEEDRISFASHIRQQLMNMNQGTKKGLWNRWLRTYWEGRNQGVPVPLSNGELNKMVEWAGELESVFPDVVDTILAGSVPQISQTSLFYRLNKKNNAILTDYPEAVSKLLIHLTSKTKLSRHFCSDLEKLADQLISDSAPKPLLMKICDHLAALGCLNAAKLKQRIQN